MIIKTCKNSICKLIHVSFFTNVILMLSLSILFLTSIITMTTNSSYAGFFSDSPRTKLFKTIAKGDDIDNTFESILKTILDKKDKKDKQGVSRINQTKSSLRNSWNKKTLLSYAVEMKRPKIVQMLLNSGADPDILYTINIAINNCDYNIVKILINHAKPIEFSVRYKKDNSVDHVTSKAHRCGKEFSALFIEKYSEYSIKDIHDNRIASGLEPLLFNKFIQKLLEKNKFNTPKDFLELSDENLNLKSLDQETFNLISDWFYKLSPSREDVIKFIKLTQANPINEKKSLLDAFEFFYTKPTSPIFENAQTLISLASIENKNHIRSIVIQKNIPQNSQNIIDLYKPGRFKQISTAVIEKFLNFKPTLEQILNFISLISSPQKEEIMDQAVQAGIIKGPEDFISKDTKDKKQIFSADFLNWFFSFKNPYPTTKQVLKLISMSSDQKQKDEIRNRTLNLNGGIILKQGDFAENFLAFYENKSDVILDDAIITQFLSFNNPAPTIEQVLAFTNLAKPEQRINIKRMAYNKYNLVKTPHDFVTLFSSIDDFSNKPTNDNEQALENIIFESVANWFFNSKPLPTFEDVLALIKLARTNKQKTYIAGLALKNNIPNTKKDILALLRSFNNTTHTFTDFLKNYFIKLKLSFIGNEINEIKNIFAKKDHPKLMETITILNQDLALEHLKNQIKDDISVSEANELNGNCVNESSNGKIRYSLLGFAKNLNKKLEENNQTQEIECPMCLCDNPVNNFHTCSNPKCQQKDYKGSRCMNCHKRSIDVQLKDNRYPLACDICGEEIALSDNDYDLLGLNNQKLDIIKRTVLSYHLKRFPDSKNCHTANCANKILKKECDKNMHYSCNFCGNSYCFECGENHEGNCKTYKAERDEKLRQSGLMDCPYCLAWSERTEGCAYVKCANCGEHFNFRTGGPWDDKSANHLNNWHAKEKASKQIIKDKSLIYDRNIRNQWDKKQNL
ncbi:MAG: hypothetical protein HQK49_17710 [Oligoflexia bacterium]|nr:hypothetical protein [Oligoflexia bacterium]